MKLKTNNGSALQITLVLLLILSLNIFSLCQITILNSRSFKGLKEVNETRLIENILLANYKYENKNSILLSNYLTIDAYAISYTVDDMGNYFYIETTIEKENKKQVNPQEEIIYKRFEEDLKMTFGTKVNINRKSKDKGKIEIEYYSEAELERLVELIESIQPV